MTDRVQKRALLCAQKARTTSEIHLLSDIWFIFRFSMRYPGALASLCSYQVPWNTQTRALEGSSHRSERSWPYAHLGTWPPLKARARRMGNPGNPSKQRAPETFTPPRESLGPKPQRCHKTPPLTGTVFVNACRLSKVSPNRLRCFQPYASGAC